MRASFACLTLAAVLRGDTGPTLRFGLTTAVALALRRLSLPRALDAVTLLALALQAWVEVGGVYATAGALRPLTHGLIALAAAIVLYVLLVRLRVVPDLNRAATLHQRAAMLLVAFAFGFATGIWQ